MAMESNPNQFFIGTGIVRSYDAAGKAIKKWTPDTPFALNDLVINNDVAAYAGGTLPIGLFKCTTAGTSASSGGPTGAGSDIADGATLKWQRVVLEDRGDVSQFEIQGEADEIEKQDHRSGVGQIVLTGEKLRKFTLAVTMGEMTLENLALGLYGTISGVSGNRLMEGGGAARPWLYWEVEGLNDYGQKYQVVVPRCQVRPPKGVGFIQEDFASLECEGRIFAIPGGNSYFVRELGAIA